MRASNRTVCGNPVGTQPTGGRIKLLVGTVRTLVFPGWHLRAYREMLPHDAVER
jgi:hypothetical protein